MTAETNGGRGPWGTDTPQDEQQARDRLLQAAEACYADQGVARTTMVDIARKAGVHRSTVYAYFPGKDAVLAACFVRSIGAVLDAAEPCFETDQPFLQQLVDAMVVGLETARNSRAVMLLLRDDQVGRTYRAAETSEDWRNELVDGIGRRLEAAVASRELRDDVTVETMARWVTRIAFSLIQEPGSPRDGGDRGILNAFLPGALARQVKSQPR